ATGSSGVSVTRDASGAKDAIHALVKAYNDFASNLADATKFDPTGGHSGPLLGDASARTIQSQLRGALSEALPGLSGNSAPVLAAAGISFQRDGTLTVDDAKLSAALERNPDDVAALFTSMGRASDSLVDFTKAGANTPPGNYSLNVTALATQGRMVGTAPPGTTITAGVNDQLSVTIDGISATVTLAPGTYTVASLAAQVQAAINGASALSANGVGGLVPQSGGMLTISSKRYGSASTVSASGTAAGTLFGNAPSSTPGTDASGTMNGSAAVGSGQTLTSLDGLAVQ